MQNAVEVPSIERELLRRRAAVAAEWGGVDAVVLIGAGGLIHRLGRDDTTYRFESHSEYYYLTDRNFCLTRCSRSIQATVGSSSTHRSPRATVCGRGPSPADAERMSTDDLEGWLAARAGRKLAWLGCARVGTRFDAELTGELRYGLSRVRRPKDPVELERMRAAPGDQCRVRRRGAAFARRSERAGGADRARG